MASKAQQELTVMARAFARVMGREFVDGDRHDAPVGAWYIERADTQKPLYRLAGRLRNGAVTHPISSAALSARGLSDALYFARLAIGVERTGHAPHELGFPYSGEQDESSV